jgi:hypothetical protein
MLVAFPLLLIPFAIYNMVAFLTPGVSWSAPIATVHMLSGADWTVSAGDALLGFAILILFLEILKATRLGMRSITDHVLSLLLFMAMMAEFIVVKEAATSTFLLLAVLSFVDVVGGFSITIRTAQRDVAIDAADKLSS